MDLDEQIKIAGARFWHLMVAEGACRSRGTPVELADARTSSLDAAAALLMLTNEREELRRKSN